MVRRKVRGAVALVVLLADERGAIVKTAVERNGSSVISLCLGVILDICMLCANVYLLLNLAKRFLGHFYMYVGHYDFMYVMLRCPIGPDT